MPASHGYTAQQRHALEKATEALKTLVWQIHTSEGDLDDEAVHDAAEKAVRYQTAFTLAVLSHSLDNIRP